MKSEVLQALRNFQSPNADLIHDENLPLIIRNTMMDTEIALKEDGELGPYLNWVDSLDNVCKECYVTHGITKSQWDDIMSRYSI